MKHARPGGIRPWTDHLAGVYQVLIREGVVTEGLRISARRHPVSQIGEERPALEIEHIATNLHPMRMDVDDARHDGRAIDLNRFCSGGNLERAGRADRG